MMDYRAQRDYYRAQRRAYRRQRRGYFGGIGGVIWLIIIISMFSSHWFWMVFPWLFIGLPIFWWGIRPMLWGNANQQQQPYSQPEQQAQPYTQPEPIYQPYNQGYASQQSTAQPQETYQEGGQSYQYQPGQQQTQQYEEPLTMYPQE